MTFKFHVPATSLKDRLAGAAGAAAGAGVVVAVVSPALVFPD
jgi:hypothetical protein